jgi:cysteinyl-tRNA synthetase
MIVIDTTLDPASGRTATSSELAPLKRKPDGSRRIVLAYLSVGEAADYRPYWQPGWSEHAPSWLGPENPNWPHAYPVRFWAPEWQAILFGGPNSMLDTILAAGFDGVFLDRIDVYGEWRKERPTAPQDMVALVGAIRSYARSRNPDFLMIGQNSEPLLAHEAYRTALDAVSKESLLFGLAGEGLENTPEQIAWSEHYLREATAAGLPVFAIEYLSDPEKVAAARRRLLQLGLIPFFGRRLLDRLPE